MFAFIIGLNNIMLNNHSIAILHMLMTKVQNRGLPVVRY